MGFAWIAPNRRRLPRHEPVRGGWWAKKKAAAEPPMAEEGGVLRNDFFEVRISPTLGAIESVLVYGSRGNRMSQQVAFRFPQARGSLFDHGRRRDARQPAAGPIGRAKSSAGAGSSTARPSVWPASCRPRGFGGEAGSWRWKSKSMPERLPDGDPWQSYYAARFAWNDESAELFRSVNTIGRRTDAK